MSRFVARLNVQEKMQIVRETSCSFFERVEAICGSLLSEASRHCSPKAPHVKKLEKKLQGPEDH